MAAHLLVCCNLRQPAIESNHLGQGLRKVTPSGKETVLHSFTGNPDGAYPFSSTLVFDTKGNVYGTTNAGGTSNVGAVFKMTPSGKETVPYSFSGGADGSGPQAGVVCDKKGNLYGTTDQGGAYGNGTLFKLVP